MEKQFKIGTKVKDLSNIEGEVVESPNLPLIRVAFGRDGDDWRDLHPDQLTEVGSPKTNPKTKYKVDIHKDGFNNSHLLTLIGLHNEGKTVMPLKDWQGVLKSKFAEYPHTNKELVLIEDEGGVGIIHISEDGGKTFTLTIAEYEVYELEPEKEEGIYLEVIN